MLGFRNGWVSRMVLWALAFGVLAVTTPDSAGAKRGLTIHVDTDSIEDAPGDSFVVRDDEGKEITRVHIHSGSGFLGIYGRRLSELTSRALDVPGGLVVSKVTSNSAAARAGIRRGDVITAIDETEIESMDDLRACMDGHNSGDTVRIHALRARKPMVLAAVLDADVRSRVLGGHDMVRFGDNINIEPGQTVDGDVVGIGGDVNVAGEVTGNVVSVGGSVKLQPTAVVHGDAVSVMGELDPQPGAQVMGQTVSVGGPTGWHLGPRFFKFGREWGWIKFLGRLGWLLMQILCLGLLYLLFRERFVNTARVVSQHTVKAFFVGLMVLCISPLLFLVLLVTLIGIPLALIFAFVLLPTTMVIGYLAGSVFLGKRLLGHGEDWARSNMSAGVAGIIFLNCFGLVGALSSQFLGGFGEVFGFGLRLVGLVLFAMTLFTGLGAVVLSRFSRSGQPGPGLFGGGRGYDPMAPMPPAGPYHVGGNPGYPAAPSPYPVAPAPYSTPGPPPGPAGTPAAPGSSGPGPGGAPPPELPPAFPGS